MFKLLSMGKNADEHGSYCGLCDTVSLDTLPPCRETALKVIGEYDAIIAPLQFRTDKEIIDAGKRLKAIFTATTGLDHIDIEYAAMRGIPVYGMKNDREFLDSITATAEQALALLLGVVRRIPWAFDSVKAGEWNRDRYKGHQLSGKTMGILGCGRLGTIMAQYASALRMRVIGCDILPINLPGVESVSLDELMRQSDVLSIHVHLNDSTRGMIGGSELAKMKRGSFLINTSRAAIVDEDAMIEALESGILAGVGVDIIDGEWMEDKTQSAVVRYAREHENLLISPHVGGACYESQAMAMENTLRKASDFFSSGCNIRGTENLVRSLMNAPVSSN